MARSYATIRTQIWKNPDFATLSPDAQWAFLMLISQNDINLCGVIPYRPKFWATLAAGLTAARVRKACDALVAADFVFIDDTTDDLWVRSFIKYDNVLKQPNVAIRMAKDFQGLHSERIAALVRESLPERLRPHFPEAFLTLGGKALGQLIRDASDEPAPEPTPEPFEKGSHSKRSVAQPSPELVDDDPPLLQETYAELARRDLAHANAAAALGKGEQIRSGSSFRKYRERERRMECGPEARRLVADYAEWTATELADVLEGQTERLRHKRRSG